MTNNNWEEDYNAFVEDIRSNYGEFYPSLAKYVSEFISNLITKKDQEHKAELESIKNKIRKLKTSYAEAPFDDYVLTIKKQDALSILDKHINK